MGLRADCGCRDQNRRTFDSLNRFITAEDLVGPLPGQNDLAGILPTNRANR